MLMERYQEKVFGYLYRFCGYDREAALDISQGVFLKAYRSLADYDIRRSFAPWLLRIAHNEAANYLRGKARRRESGWSPDNWDSLPDSREDNPEAHQVESDRSARVLKALEQLPQQQQEALKLHFFEDSPYEDIAEIMGIPRGTVGTLIHRGKKQLRLLLEEAVRQET